MSKVITLTEEELMTIRAQEFDAGMRIAVDSAVAFLEVPQATKAEVILLLKNTMRLRSALQDGGLI